MKNSLFILVLTILLGSCVSINKMANNAIYNAIIGQNEKTIYSRLGTPKKTIPAPDEGKILIYEFYSKGMFATPYKSKVTYSPNKDLLGNREGIILKGGVNTVTNDPKYTIYENDVSYLKVFLDKQRNCVRFEQNMTKEQLNQFYERLKQYIPES